MNRKLVKVSSKSSPSSVAGSIAVIVKEMGSVDVIAIGVLAVSNCAKSLAIVRGFLATNDIDVEYIPSFVDVDIAGETKTALKWTLIRKKKAIA